MKNQVFQAQTEDMCRKKLDTALRRITADRLTEEQRQLIEKAVGPRRQNCLRILEDPGAFCLRVNPKNGMDGQSVFSTIFGDLEELEKEAAVLVRGLTPQDQPCVVYIYLPRKKRRKWDDSRKEETTGA